MLVCFSKSCFLIFLFFFPISFLCLLKPQSVHLKICDIQGTNYFITNSMQFWTLALKLKYVWRPKSLIKTLLCSWFLLRSVKVCGALWRCHQSDTDPSNVEVLRCRWPLMITTQLSNPNEVSGYVRPLKAIIFFLFCFYVFFSTTPNLLRNTKSLLNRIHHTLIIGIPFQ